MSKETPKVWSPQQQAVFDWVKTGTGSTFIEAVAGSGKTTTLVEACRHMNGYVALAAYNKKIADELAGKIHAAGLGNRVSAGTFHSFGVKSWRRYHPKVKAGPEVARLKSEHVAAKLKMPKEYRSFVDNLVSHAKQRGIGCPGMANIREPGAWLGIIRHFDLEWDLPKQVDLDKAVEFAQAALNVHIQLAPEYCDFNDMLYMPIYSGIRMWEHDWVLVDEAQDTNPVRRQLARRMLKPGTGRAIFVGDRHQAIYGFTGADNDAVDQIVRDFDCTQLPLTTTYRCPKAVVTAAQQFVSHIEAHETAPEGVVRRIVDNALLREGLTPGQDAILCRNTRPIVGLAYDLISKGIPAHVEGRDIGQGLIKLINKFNGQPVERMLRDLDAYVGREVAAMTSKGKDMAAAALLDRAETIHVLAEGASTTEHLKAKIEKVFQDSDGNSVNRLVLSTVHKAKGREWERVFLLGEERFMPSKYARQDWELDQETNLIYVAYTRAKSELVLVEWSE